MLETRATVVESRDRTTWVVAADVSSCEQCNGKGCGSSKVAQLFCSKPRRFEVENSIGAVVGDEVIISVADGAVLQGIGLLYLLPLALMVILGGIADFMHAGDASVAVGAIAGLLLGFAFARLVSASRSNVMNKPYIAKRSSV